VVFKESRCVKIVDIDACVEFDIWNWSQSMYDVHKMQVPIRKFTTQGQSRKPVG
jgi:hypothetical protein